MKDTEYEGKPCKHGHTNENGKTIRNKRSKCCVVCEAAWTKKHRTNNQKYIDYQAAYYKRMKTETPEKLLEYQQTQIRRGNRPGKIVD